MICLAISSAALSLAPYFFGKVINYSIPGTNWYDSMYPRVFMFYAWQAKLQIYILCHTTATVLLIVN